MTAKSNSKTKGHRYEIVNTKYHVEFYTEEFFAPKNEEDDEVVERKTVKIPTKINAEDGDNRSNVIYAEIPAIQHFDNNVENVLTSIAQLKERVVDPLGRNTVGEVQYFTKMLKLLAPKAPASTTLQEALESARKEVFESHIPRQFINDGVTEADIRRLLKEQNLFFDFIGGDNFEDEMFEGFEGLEDFQEFLHERFRESLMNHLNNVIFGVDAYRAFKHQVNYMETQLIKPFSVSVDAAFRRIEVMAKQLEFFPPTYNRGAEATEQQWDDHKRARVLSAEAKREIKYRLLPASAHERFDELEEDWEGMTDAKFLAEAQKWETAEARRRERLNREKEKLKKRKNDSSTDSTSSLSRSSQDSNQKGKKRRNNGGQTGSGTARYCALCKLAGAPERVFKTHYTNQCKKEEEYKKQLSGSLGARDSASRDLKKRKEYYKRELKSLQKMTKRARITPRVSSRTATSIDYSSESDSDSDNASH